MQTGDVNPCHCTALWAGINIGYHGFGNSPPTHTHARTLWQTHYYIGTAVLCSRRR